MKERFGALQLQVGNRFNSNIIPKNGTHKSDKINHGLGLKSVQEIVRRHHGKSVDRSGKMTGSRSISSYMILIRKNCKVPESLYKNATPHNYLCGVVFPFLTARFAVFTSKESCSSSFWYFLRCQTGIGFEVMHKVRLIKISQICGNFR